MASKSKAIYHQRAPQLEAGCVGDGGHEMVIHDALALKGRIRRSDLQDIPVFGCNPSW
jgi:hypothetical protein